MNEMEERHMWKNCLTKKRMKVLRMSFVMLACCACVVLTGGNSAVAAEPLQPTKQEYQTRYDNAVGLAELLRTSPDMLHNKLYTSEQEVELRSLVDSVCDGKNTNRAKAQALLVQIFNRLEPGSGYELNGWDTLCDGENDFINTSGKVVGKKKAVDDEVYCYTFYDVCRLAGIPCFIVEDAQVLASRNRYIAMVYIETVSGTGRDWYFVDVAAEQLQLVSRENAYETLGTEFYPANLVLDYDKALYFRNVISLSKDSRVESKEVPKLVYDSTENKVKVYFSQGAALAAGEQYYMTETYVGEDGVAPSGWIETKDYSEGTVTTYRSYAVCGVFLRGRVEIEGKEVELQTDDFKSYVSFYDHQAVGNEPESEEHKKFVLDYKKQLEDKTIAYAKALLADKNYIWDDTYFENEEDEKLVREAVSTALNWDYVTANEASQTAFLTAGIPFVSWEEQSSETLSDKAKAEAILLYIHKNVQPVEHGPNFVNSASVLKQGVGTCEGFSRLYRDMCVLAGVPCFKLSCSLGMRMGDTLFRDHGNNLIKVGDEWLFCDPMASGVIGKGDCYEIGIFEGYDTANSTEIFIDNGAVRKDTHVKWSLGTMTRNYFDFDRDGKLGIYQRNRYGEPVVDSETDENGRFTMENGLHTVDIAEKNEDGSAEIVTQYAYYYQNCRTLLGKKIINGTEYYFDTDVRGVSAKCHKLGEVSRRYVISKLTFQPLADQPYEEGGVCPVPDIYHGDKKLEYGKDFTIVEYKHNKELTTYADASYQVEGIGDYTGNATRYFKIVKADISQREVKLSKTSIAWNPNKESRKPQVDLGLFSRDYSVVYYDYDKIGTARVVITGKGNYQGSVTKEYEITPGVWNAEEFMITDEKGKPLQSQKFDYQFTPVAVPARVCWQDEKGEAYILSEANDYELTYRDTEHPGIVTVTATAKGNYQGTLTCTYEITPYILREEAIKTEYTQTVYNGTVQKPAVRIDGFVEGKDYFVTYEKKENGVWQEAEPKEAGEYRIVLRISGDFAILKEGIPEEEASDVCYILYTIADDGSGGSGSEGSGGSGSTGGSGSASEGPGGSGNTGGSGSASEGPGGSGSTGSGSSGSSTGGSGAGTDVTGANGTTDDAGSLGSGGDTIQKLTLTAKKKAIKISWSKVKKANGYQIQISRYKNYKKAKTVNVKKSKKSYTFRKLKKKTKYYIRIRVYKGTVGTGKNKKKIYGKWKKASQKAK